MSTALLITKGPRLRRPAFDRERALRLRRRFLMHAATTLLRSPSLRRHWISCRQVCMPPMEANLHCSSERSSDMPRRPHCHLRQLLSSDAHPVDVLTNVLIEAAKQYRQDGAPRGCMVTEAMRADDPHAAAAAAALAEPGIAAIQNYVKISFFLEGRTRCRLRAPHPSRDFFIRLSRNVPDKAGQLRQGRRTRVGGRVSAR